MGSPISGPIAYLNNVPINPQWYSPRQQFISNITLGLTTTVTTTTDTQFVIGQTCRLLIPPQCGCRQLNEIQGNVISIPNSNQVILNIDSSMNVNAFISSPGNTQPQIIPIGDINQGAINPSGNSQTGTFIPGSFIDISPD